MIITYNIIYDRIMFVFFQKLPMFLAFTDLFEQGVDQMKYWVRPLPSDPIICPYAIVERRFISM